MNPNPFVRTILNYGALSGLASFAVFLALYYKGMNPMGAASWMGAWIPVVFICLATKRYRDDYNEGFLTYGQGFKTGLMTTFAASLLFALLVYIFATLIDHSMLEMYKTEMRNGMEETKFIFSDEMYERGLESIEKLTITTLAYNDFFMKMLGGLVVSLITAAIFRRQPPPLEP